MIYRCIRGIAAGFCGAHAPNRRAAGPGSLRPARYSLAALATTAPICARLLAALAQPYGLRGQRLRAVAPLLPAARVARLRRWGRALSERTPPRGYFSNFGFVQMLLRFGAFLLRFSCSAQKKYYLVVPGCFFFRRFFWLFRGLFTTFAAVFIR